MIEKKQLENEILSAFGSIPFPLHRGLHAAMAMDDWIEDEETLKQITAEKDYIGEWWNIPKSDLRSCMMALCYLDAHGIEFYLPAYMLAIISAPTTFDIPHIKSSSWQVVWHLLPPDNDLNWTKEEIDWFYEQLSRIQGDKKRAVHSFLMYISSREEYDEHARSIASKALQHGYWKI